MKDTYWFANIDNKFWSDVLWLFAVHDILKLGHIARKCYINDFQIVFYINIRITNTNITLIYEQQKNDSSWKIPKFEFKLWQYFFIISMVTGIVYSIMSICVLSIISFELHEREKGKKWSELMWCFNSS